MIKIKIIILSQLFLITGITAQILPHLNYPDVKYNVEKWDSKWVTCQDIPEADYAVVMFRRTFSLPEKPERFVVHVSADNRYKLYVNGKYASMGPQLSDWRHWRYETIDIAPYLQQGENVIAAEVTNWGPDRHFGIMSIRTAFMMQGETKNESVVNTSFDEKWKAKKNESYNILSPNWIFAVDITGGFYAANPGDSVNMVSAVFPHDWTSASFDDSEWKPARWIWNIANEDESGFFWLMKPRSTPQVAQEKVRFKKVVRSEGVTTAADFIKGTKPLVIPRRSKASLLLDYETVTMGFPELVLSGGKDSYIKIRYAENLFNTDKSKGDRSDFEGKHLIGLRDAIVPDGRAEYMFTPTWYRTFRFVQIDIETAEEELTLHDYYNMYTSAAMKRLAEFDCDNPVYKKIDEICWRTASICTQDNLLSDAYYEQMMYVGDSWVHALVNLYMTGDVIWLRNAIEQFDYSRMPDGNILGCYPLKATFPTSSFTLIWVEMLYDLMMYSDEKEFIRKYAHSVRSTFNSFENNLLDNGLVGKPFCGYFVDWYGEEDFAGAGCYPGSANGNSAVVTLHYAATLLRAADIFDYLDLHGEAITFREKADKLKSAVVALCWDEEKGLFAENPDKKFYDERTNIMAIKAQVFDREGQKKLLTRCLDDMTISKPTYYFRMNHFHEMRRLGEGAQMDKVLDIWKDLLPLNMTTTPERIVHQRSEAHPWGASPSIAFVNLAAGISPAGPGYKSVNIEPALGALNFIKASYPHYLGNIKVDLKKTQKNGVEGTVELPKGLTGVFRYNDRVISLREGVQKITLQ